MRKRIHWFFRTIPTNPRCKSKFKCYAFSNSRAHKYKSNKSRGITSWSILTRAENQNLNATHFQIHALTNTKASFCICSLVNLLPKNSDLLVEPEGFEPSSKQANIKLSTGLDDAWFSSGSWPSTTDYPAYPFNFGLVQGFPAPILNSSVPSLGLLSEKVSPKTSCPPAWRDGLSKINLVD